MTENINNDKVDKETKTVNNPQTSTPKANKKQNAPIAKSSQTFWLLFFFSFVFFFIFTKHYLRILISALAISSLKVNLKTRIKIRTLEELTRHKFHLLPIPNLNQHISQDIKTTLLKKGLY